MSSSDIEALKSAVGAQTDAELAGYLGITRTTISQWRLRGKIPKKYKSLLVNPTKEELRGSLRKAFQIKFYGSTENRLWISIALPFIIERCDPNDDPLHLEEEFINILSDAMRVCESRLKKVAPDSEEDVRRIVDYLRSSGSGSEPK